MMDLKTLQWDDSLLKQLGIPKCCLPEIRSNSEVYGFGAKGGYLDGVRLSGILGDQQAALFGQACFEPGEVKVSQSAPVMETGGGVVHRWI